MESNKIPISVHDLAKIADDIWAMAEGKMDKSEKNLKRVSSVLHDFRAGRNTEWYLKE